MKLNRFALAGAVVAAIVPALSAQSSRLVVKIVPDLVVRIVPDKSIPVVGTTKAPSVDHAIARTPATEAQVVRLDNAFEHDWVKYDMTLGQLGSLHNAERVARTEQVSRNFYRNFGRTASAIIPPPQRDRYIQFGIPCANYNAFTDPAIIQGLGLTTQQREQFLRLGDEYNLRMNQLNQGLGTTPGNANQQLNDFRYMLNVQVNAILNARQREQWRSVRLQ